VSDAIAAAPAVALLFEDVALGARLRQALQDRGAQIVLEDSATHTTPAAVAGCGAEVVVISLEPAAEDAIERFYDALDGSRQRLVFNDAEASRRLSGWDQARWARHLAAKILGSADVDPPRPADARAVDVPVTAVEAEASPVAIPMPVASAVSPPAAAALEPMDIEAPEQPATAPQPTLATTTSHDTTPVAPESGAISDAELAALFELLPAAVEPAVATTAPAMPLADPTALDDEIAALLAGSPLLDAADAGPQAPAPSSAAAGPPMVEDIDAWLARVSVEQEQDTSTAPVSAAAPVAPVPAIDLSLAPLDALPAAHEPVATATPATFPDAPDWGLLEFDLPDGFEPLPPVPGATPKTAVEFGIETVSAADYLAPASPSTAGAPPFEVDLGGLELIPFEEALAPHVEVASHEMNLTEQRSALRRVVVIGASIGGPEALHEFLAALPGDLPAALVVAQHLDAAFNGSLTQQLGKAGTLPVRLAAAGASLRHGEVLVVPSGMRLRVERSGRVQLEPLPADSPYDPSIDDTFTAIAETFGPDVLALILSGMASDAVAGAHAVAARGGRVWGQEPSTCVVSSMVDAAGSAGLIGYFAAPRDLAARLASELGRGQA
jgi:two-component system chemotaxis response regulator CheB/chemosensory pili system protein ChpB (putative protein-glutamate methylesterase)